MIPREGDGPLNGAIYTCIFPESSALYAIHFPFGEKAAAVSLALARKAVGSHSLRNRDGVAVRA